jgi:hypothetical protein
MDGHIGIPGESWIPGGMPDEGRIVSWGVQSINHEDISFWQGSLAVDVADSATTALVDQLR